MKKLHAALLSLYMTVGLVAAADNGPSGDSGSSTPTPIVEIDGIKLTLGDFEEKRPGGLFQARNNFYDAERKAVDEFVNDYLLQREAQKENITVAQLLERHVNSAGFKAPSEETLRVYYEGVDTTEPFENVRDKIIEAIRTRRLARAKSAYLQSLRGSAKVVFKLDPPRAPISLKDTPVRGKPDAPVMLVEFADYECPYCQQIQPVVEKLIADYSGRVAFAFKDFPLPMHTHAQQAAEAARCAGTQGKYWEFHDQLFANHQYDTVKLKEIAKGLRLDDKTFNNCLDSGQQAEAVKEHFAESQVLGLPGTPAFFVNGRLINPNGNVSYDTLRQLVDEELAVSAQRAKDPSSSSSTKASNK
jgi:protein-disulfide isomerase